MKLHSVPFADILIPENRQRKNMNAEALLELAGSIAEVGLIHPVVLRQDSDNEFILVAGERRLRAMEYVWNFGQSVRCSGQDIPNGEVPCLFLGEIDPIQAYRIELEENVRRTDLSWQEKAQATARLAKLSEEISGETPSPAALAEEIGLSPSEGGGGSAAQAVRQDLILANHLADPDIAKATSRQEAFKILKRKEETAKNAALGAKIGVTLKDEHRLIRGNCLEELAKLPETSFDVICTDPPYGMNAQDFGDSAGTGGAVGGHFYDDSPETWVELMKGVLPAIMRVCKPQAHFYMFYDIDNYWQAKQLVMWASMKMKQDWRVFRTPLVWFNPGGSRAPWPQHGPQRKTQYILFAERGRRPVTALYGDLISCSSDSNLGHPAQKPVPLFIDLLRRSVRPGDSVLDPFAGTGVLFPAAHALKCRATCIEIDEAACGIAAKRLEALK